MYEESTGSDGYDAHKNVPPADVQDRAGARLLRAELGSLAARLKKIWAYGAYGGKEPANWCEEQGGWEIEVVERDRWR